MNEASDWLILMHRLRDDTPDHKNEFKKTVQVQTVMLDQGPASKARS